MTVLGLIFIPWTVLTIALGRRGWVPWLLAAAAPFLTGSALIAGDNKVSPFFVAAFAPLWFVAVHPKGATVTRNLYGIALLVVGFMAATALVLPKLFAGTPVLIPRGGVDEQVAAPGELGHSVSNIAQTGYLVLAVAVVLFFANNRPRQLHFINLAFIVGTVLNMWALIGVGFPAEVFDAGVGERYVSLYGDAARLRGIFSEPSYLATFSLAGLVFNGFLLRQVRGRAAAGAWAMVGANFVALYYSYSGTAVVSFVIFLVALVALQVWGFARGAVRPPPALVAGLLFAAAAAVLLAAPLIDYGQSLVGQKLTTTSYSNRSAADGFSWHLLLDTGGLGVGLGSSRPSSFALLLLSNVGVIGTALFVVLVLRCVLPALRDQRYAPEVWALGATLTAKVIAEPNLAQPTMWLLIAACAAASAPRVPSDAWPTKTSTQSRTVTSGLVARSTTSPRR